MRIRAGIILKSLVTILLLAAAVRLWAAEADTIPNALAQYVRAARQAGMSESKIVKAAVAMGWPEPLAKAAVAQLLAEMEMN